MISFLLPTNRIDTHTDVVFKSIHSIIDTHKNENFEILLFTQDSKKTNDLIGNNRNIKLIQENGRRGPIFGFNKMCRESQGDIIVCSTDENIILENCGKYIDEINDIGIAGLNPGSPNMIPRQGQILGDKILQKDVPPIFNLRWPVISRKFLQDKLNGYIFHPSFFYHAGDI
jgi:hypothetical protein